MPEMNGIDATIEIKKIREKLPIIAQTAYAMRDEQKLVIEAGCNDLVTKPINSEILIETLAKFLL